MWVSTDGGLNYEQVTDLSILPNSDGYSYIVGYKSSLTPRDSSSMKLKVELLNYKTAFVYATCLAVDYS